MFLYSIEDDEAKKTFLAIIRARWPLGKYMFSDIDAAYPKWLGLRVEEFLVSTFLFTCPVIDFVGNWFDYSILILVLVDIM